ncbi:MAG: hypothetical protein ACLSVF_08070, partial [Faecalibacterium sp.]
LFYKFFALFSPLHFFTSFSWRFGQRFDIPASDTNQSIRRPHWAADALPYIIVISGRRPV